MLGIIGGSGLGEALFAEAFGTETKDHAVGTPYGRPSSPIRVVSWGGIDVAILARHGDGHVFPPSMVPYRANVFALKKLGVTHLLTTGAVSSLRAEAGPPALLLVDQLIDKTYRRVPTFFDEGMAVHADLTQPYCATLRERLMALPAQGAGLGAKATYVCIEGPESATAAEADLHRAWGADVMGMTALPEARLAREASMCCALIVLEGDLKAATASTVALLKAAVADIAKTPLGACACQSSLERAITTRRDRILPATIEKYGPLLAKYFGEKTS